jgi:hypothetical protein
MRHNVGFWEKPALYWSLLGAIAVSCTSVTSAEVFSVLQFVVAGSITAYLCQFAVYMHRRSRQSWESILGQTPKHPWARARVLMEMGDYAERHGYQGEQLLSLRGEAMQTRVGALLRTHS